MRVSIDFSEAEIVWADRAVANGLFEDREMAIRGVMGGSFGDLGDTAIAKAYSHAYSKRPASTGDSEIGLAFLSGALRAERGES